MNIVTEVFERLDKWRNLPKYALERRADIFFAVYLKTALETKYETRLNEVIIPEFPIRKATIYPNIQGNSSVNVDYLAFSHDTKTVFLVELKTDIGSRRDVQDDYLEAAASIRFSEIVLGLVKIFQTTAKRRKYFHLFKMLEDAGVVELPNQLQAKISSQNIRGVKALIGEVKIIAEMKESKVVYLQPTGEGKNVITFNEFGSYIEGFDDPFTQRFVESLKIWSETEAGDFETR